MKMMIQECEAMGMGVRLIPKPQGQVTELVIKKPTTIRPKVFVKEKDSVTVVKPVTSKSRDKFVVGDTVKVNKPGHQFDMSYCIIKQVMARKQYRLMVTNDLRNSMMIVDSVFKLGERFLEKVDKISEEFKDAGYGDKTYSFIPFVKSSDSGKGNLREDIDEHVEMWKDYQSQRYTRDDLDKLISLFNEYNKDEIEKLGLSEPIYLSLIHISEPTRRM